MLLLTTRIQYYLNIIRMKLDEWQREKSDWFLDQSEILAHPSSAFSMNSDCGNADHLIVGTANEPFVFVPTLACSLSRAIRRKKVGLRQLTE